MENKNIFNSLKSNAVDLPFPDEKSVSWILNGQPVEGDNEGSLTHYVTNIPIDQVFQNTLAIADTLNNGQSIPMWDNTQMYEKYAIVEFTDNLLYTSLIDGNKGNMPGLQSSSWHLSGTPVFKNYILTLNNSPADTNGNFQLTGNDDLKINTNTSNINFQVNTSETTADSTVVKRTKDGVISGSQFRATRGSDDSFQFVGNKSGAIYSIGNTTSKNKLTLNNKTKNLSAEILCGMDGDGNFKDANTIPVADGNGNFNFQQQILNYNIDNPPPNVYYVLPDLRKNLTCPLIINIVITNSLTTDVWIQGFDIQVIQLLPGPLHWVYTIDISPTISFFGMLTSASWFISGGLGLWTQNDLMPAGYKPILIQ